jgi:hypothetical protein
MSQVKLLFTFCFLLFTFFLPTGAKAVMSFDLTATPSVIDVTPCEKSQICLKEDIAIKNNSAQQADVYAQVNDLSATSGIISYADPSQLPADASLVRWIDFYRAAITIPPGQTAVKTLTITASPHAQPGKYHAIISFPVGNNLSEAQTADQLLNEAKVQINMEVVAHRVEQAEINIFQPAAALFTKNNISFNLKIKNIGTEAAVPAGEITIYDKSGRDVAAIPIAAATIAPNEIKIFPAAAKLNIGPGKFKAILNLNYGQDNGKNLTDIVYFSYLPLNLFLVLLALILGIIIVVAFCLHKKRKKKYSAEPGAHHQNNLETSAGNNQVDLPPAIRPKHHHKYIINLKK